MQKITTSSLLSTEGFDVDVFLHFAVEKGFVMLKDACAMGLVDIPGT